MRRLIMVLAGLALFTAGLGAWQGNVFAPVFALLESAAVAVALSIAWRAGERGECISFDDSSLEVRWLPGRGCIRFQTYWTRLRMEQGDGRDRLVLSSHGEKLEIGAFLTNQERIELGKKLMVLLSDHNGLPRK